jgi:putative transcriptional regulator
MDDRKALTLEACNFLEKEGFDFFITEDKSSCFDILASKMSFIVMFKFLLNIDSLNGEVAYDLKSLSRLLSAHPLIIGDRTRNFGLQDGVLYGRHGINAFTLNTFQEIVSQNLYPLISSRRGGHYVRIDGEKLRRLRVEKDISCRELGDSVGVSRTMIYCYENNGLGATLSTVLKLEEFLDTSLALPLDVFSINGEMDYKPSAQGTGEEVFLKLERIGFEIHPLKRAVFDAVTRGANEQMLTKIEKNSLRKTERNAKIIKDVSALVSCSAFIISESPFVKENLDGVPIIKKSELEKMESQGDFMDTIDRRKWA